MENVKEWNNCVAKGTQLIDMAHDRSYITFDVQSNTTGYFTFTSAIATSLNDIGCALGAINASGNFISGDTLAIDNTGSWTSTKNYDWLFYLEANVTYNFKMMCFAGNSYALNAFSIKIKPFEANTGLNEISVNGFDLISGENTFVTDAYFNEDLKIEAIADASTAVVSYTAKCNDTAIDISAEGLHQY